MLVDIDIIIRVFMKKMIDIMWPTSQSHLHISFMIIEMNFYS